MNEFENYIINEVSYILDNELFTLEDIKTTPLYCLGWIYPIQFEEIFKCYYTDIEEVLESENIYLDTISISQSELLTMVINIILIYNFS